MQNVKHSFRETAIAAAIVLSLLMLVAAIDSARIPSPANDLDELNALLDEFEDAYSGKRVNDLRQLFFADAVIAYDLDEGQTTEVRSLEAFLQSTSEHVFQLNENISDTLTDREIVVYRNIAYAICDYSYVSDNKTARGIDIFTFFKQRDRWRILSLQWTGDEAVNVHSGY